MLRGVNRVLIGLAGGLLLGAGLAVLASGLWTDPDAVLLSDAARARWRDRGWWWPAVLGGLVVLVLSALGWLLAQLRRSRTLEVLVDTADGDDASLRGRALEAAMEAEAEAVRGVAHAHVRLTGNAAEPRAHLSVLVEPDASPEMTLDALTHEILAHARDSAGLGRLPAELRIRAAHHRPRRVL